MIVLVSMVFGEYNVDNWDVIVKAYKYRIAVSYKNTQHNTALPCTRKKHTVCIKGFMLYKNMQYSILYTQKRFIVCSTHTTLLFTQKIILNRKFLHPC